MVPDAARPARMPTPRTGAPKAAGTPPHGRQLGGSTNPPSPAWLSVPSGHAWRRDPVRPHRPRSSEEEAGAPAGAGAARSEEHTSELQSLMRISYAVFCLKKKTNKNKQNPNITVNNITIISIHHSKITIENYV